MTVALRNIVAIKAHQRFLLSDEQKKGNAYEVIKAYYHENQYQSSSNDTYNQLLGGRMGLLLSLAILYKQQPDDSISEEMVKVFKLIQQDILFLNDGLTWLPPYDIDSKNSFFLRNVGIYLGLSIINKHFVQEQTIPLIKKSINFEIELNEIASIRHRNLMRNMLKNETGTIKWSDLEMLVSYFNQTGHKVVLEGIICFAILGNFTQEILIKHLLVNTQIQNISFLKALIEIVSQDIDSPKKSANFSDDIVVEIMQSRLKSLYQFCGKESIEEIILKENLTQILKPSIWLKCIFKNFPQKSILFKNVIWREKLLLKPPIHLFSINTKYGNDSNKTLHKYYTNDLNYVFENKFKIDKNKIKTVFSSFWIGIIPVNNFEGLNIQRKIDEFRQNQRHTRFTILLTKRFEKVVTWQGRSFRDNDEIDFLFFFLDDFKSPNEYRKIYGNEALEYFKIVEIIFWCLEIGILIPMNEV
jgi:hypothetical protein